MDPPYTMIWNDFAIRSPKEAICRLEDRLLDIEQLAHQLSNDKFIQKYLSALTTLKNLYLNTVQNGRDRAALSWYKKLFNVNLVDAPNGFSILEIVHGNEMQIISKGIYQRESYHSHKVFR